MLQKEVYMFENIEITSQCDYENMKHLKCIAMLRPTKENIALLCKELKNPKFGSYYIYFTNIIPKADIKTLAEFDEQESVREIEELYADYLPILPHFFSLNIPLCSNGKVDFFCIYTYLNTKQAIDTGQREWTGVSTTRFSYPAI